MGFLTFDRLDHGGIAELLKSGGFASAVHAVAESIAGGINVDAEEGVVVDDYTTDRAASSVTIRDVRGMLWQVRDGVLTRAASGAGVEVKAE